MKRYIAFCLVIILSLLALSACSTDFSETINEKMDQLYNTVHDVAEPFLKEDEKYSEGGSENIPENGTPVPPSESEDESL